MKFRSLWLLTLLLGPVVDAAAQALPSTRYALAPVAAAERLDLPAHDRNKLLAADAGRGRNLPLRYAIGERVEVDARRSGKSARGAWQLLADGNRLWRLQVRAPGALSLDFGFKRMFLPHGAALYVASADGAVVRGPYTDADNTHFGGFWTPYVPGDAALIELVVPAALEPFVELELDTVNYGYRDVFSGAAFGEKSLSCEIDTACPEGDGFRSQIRAVAGYAIGSGGLVCTGQLLNNTNTDNRRLFHTANHCISTSGGADSMVLYWKYESSTCRAPGSASSGTPLSTSIAVPQTGGATLRATHAGSDATLVELNSAIPSAADPFFAGWDRRATVPPSAAVIHHPNGDEKRISLAFNSPVINTTPQTVDTIHYDAGASMDVTYDRGTSEGGSSGGGLFTPEGRVIGQVGGGPPGSCSVGITDTYGRIAASWEGAGQPSSRFRDLLDPGNSGVQILEGKSNCPAPQVALSGATTGNAGQALSYTASVSGSGPFRVDWDVDNDGVYDRSTTGVSSSTAISVSYPTATSTNVVAHVTDATGCSADRSVAINVSAPDLVPSFGAPQQLCGNGDTLIDPGERWQVPVNLFNAGGAALNSALAVFSKSLPVAATTSVGPDTFGYRAGDDGSGCGFSFVDLDGQTAALPLTPAPDATGADDDGHTAQIAVTPFDFYGSAVSGLVMSTNGYLSTAASDTGGDYDNECGLSVPNRGSAGGRINVLHDDLVVGVQATAGLRSKFFPVCPRHAESASADTGCYVFQWSHMGQFGSGGTAVGDFDLQAIVYPATNQIVYQYRNTPGDQGGSATIGIQNEAVTTGLQYACNSAVVASGRSVCIFHPNAQPLPPADPGLRIETPALGVPNLSSGQSANVNLVFALKPTAVCGAAINLKYVGTVDSVSYSLRSGNALVSNVGGGACPVANCPPQITPIALGDGLYANSSRFGNGEGIFTIPSGSEQVLFGAWFTGARNRNPAWLIVQGNLVDNQAIAPVLRFHLNPGPVFGVSSSVVGTAQVSVLNPNSYAFTFTVDGVPGGQIESVLYPGTRSSPNRTGAWFYPPESGWGQVIDDHVIGASAEEVAINYIYDTSGNPVWTLGATPGLNSGSMSLNTFRVHCPSCANFPDFGAFPLAAGSLSRIYSSLTQGSLSTQMQLPAPLSGSWIRSNIPIQMLSVPGPQ